jgi:hypothetical protein
LNIHKIGAKISIQLKDLKWDGVLEISSEKIINLNKFGIHGMKL